MTTSQQSVLADYTHLGIEKESRRNNSDNISTVSPCRLYTPGDFVVVGLKQRKGPNSVYIAEVTHVYEAECGLKYMKKS